MNDLKKIGLIYLIVSVIMLPSIAHADTGEYTDLRVVVEDIHPDIIYPGDTFNLYVRVINEGTKEAFIKDVNLVLPEGFKLISRTPLNISKELCGGCSSQLIYTIRAQPNVDIGQHPIEFDVITKDYTVKDTYLLHIQGEENLLIKVLGSNGKINGKGEIKLSLENIGDVDLKDIKIYLNDRYVTIENASFIYIPLLKKKTSRIINIPVVINKYASEGIYNINLTVEYKGNKITTKNFIVPINIKPNVEIYVSSITLSDTPFVNSPVELVMRIENNGYGKAKNIHVRISGDFYTTQQEYYLGELNSGEDSSATFTIYPKNKEVNLHYEITYIEGNISKSIEGTFRFNAQTKSKKQTYIISLIAIALIMYLIYRKFVNKSDKEE